MGSGHAQSAAGRNERSLRIVFGLALTYLVVEAVGGLWTGSLALLADAGHMLTAVEGVASPSSGSPSGSTPGPPPSQAGRARA